MPTSLLQSFLAKKIQLHLLITFILWLFKGKKKMLVIVRVTKWMLLIELWHYSFQQQNFSDCARGEMDATHWALKLLISAPPATHWKIWGRQVWI